jgi:hypothetical protein
LAGASGVNHQTRHKRVAIIVLNWNGLDDTRSCASSLERIHYPAATVFLVDNGSSDGSSEALAREFPQFTHLANAGNLGFSGGNNVVIEQALAKGFDYVLLLNNDTIVAPDFLGHLVAAAESGERVGMVGPKIFYHDQPTLLWYAGGRVDWRAWPPFRNRGENKPDGPNYDAPGATDFVTGCCVLARAEMIRQIGPLDPRYGYYCEDVDWSLRARRAGWEVRYEPQARVWHKVSRSMRRTGRSSADYYEYRNPLLAARRHRGKVGVLPIVWRALWRALLHPGGGPDKIVLIEAARDGVLGRTGLMPHAAGSSRMVRALERALKPATWLFWALNARQKPSTLEH